MRLFVQHAIDNLIHVIVVHRSEFMKHVRSQLFRLYSFLVAIPSKEVLGSSSLQGSVWLET
jgi:hypothetical protein